jgi:hypothetical protein
MKHARPDYNRIQDPENKIPENEPVFLLRAQDETAAAVVRFWASLNVQGDPHAVKLALDHARLMDQWPTKKQADV